VNIPESWLRTFCDPKLSGRELADKLTMSGVEVENYEPLGGARLDNVVVGEVLSVEKHPNADKLTVCTVKAGEETVRLVCGAPNVRVGMKAPLARIGAKEIRGVQSNGMLCSARDLGLSDDHSGLLEIDGKPGSPARAALGLDDHILTLKLTPNRADCLSILGVAREVSALTGARLENPKIERIPGKTGAKHAVRISGSAASRPWWTLRTTSCSNSAARCTCTTLTN
jgi:phenylalanyl-tRNA synthetase beta chain